MNYVKLGESIAYLVFIAAGLTIFLIWLYRQNNAKKRETVLANFRSAIFRNEDELVWFIAREVIGAAGFEDCVVYKVDQNERMCRQVAAFGLKNPEKMGILNPINIPFGRGIVGHVAETGVPEKINNTSLDKRYVPDDDVRYSEIAVPVFGEESVIFVIDAERKKVNGFSEKDGAFFLEVAKIAWSKLLKN